MSRKSESHSYQQESDEIYGKQREIKGDEEIWLSSIGGKFHKRVMRRYFMAELQFDPDSPVYIFVILMQYEESNRHTLQHDNQSSTVCQKH